MDGPGERRGNSAALHSRSSLLAVPRGDIQTRIPDVTKRTGAALRSAAKPPWAYACKPGGQEATLASGRQADACVSGSSELSCGRGGGCRLPRPGDWGCGGGSPACITALGMDG